MNTSPQCDQIIPAFAKCLGLVVKPKKGATNPHLKSKYANLESVNKAIQAALEASELVVTQPPYHEPGQLKDVLLIETVIIHVPSGQWMSSVLQMPLAKADAQGCGSAITYARRYAKLAIFDLLSGDDDGEKAVKSTTDWLREVKSANTEDELTEIFKSANRNQDAGLTKVVRDACATRKQEIKIANAKGFDPSKPANATRGTKTVTVEDEPAPEEPQQRQENDFTNEDF